MAKGLGLLPLLCKTWVTSLVPSLTRPSPGLCGHLGSNPAHGNVFLSLSLSSCVLVSVSYINFEKRIFMPTQFCFD